MLLNLCNEFTSEIQARVNGVRKPPRFFQDLIVEYHRLARELASTRPNIDIISSEDDESDDNSRSPSKMDLWKTSKIESLGKKCPLQCVSLMLIRTDAITFASVKTIIDQVSTRELPGNIPFAAHEHFHTMFVSKWRSICLNSFETVEQLLRDMVQNLCTQYFSRFATSGLLKAIR